MVERTLQLSVLADPLIGCLKEWRTPHKVIELFWDV